MIQFSQVSLELGGRRILHRVDLRLRERRIAVIGANGSGKSTFARMINGLQLPGTGSVVVDGLDTGKEAKAVRRKVGFVFQNPDNQIVLPTVEEDLKFGMQSLGLSAKRMSDMAEGVLRTYGLYDWRYHPCHRLSGGQKQILAIAGVLVTEPDYIVLDEPTTLLDLKNKRRIQDLIRSLPMTAILVTHDLDLAREFDRVIVFEAGRVVADDVPDRAIRHYTDAMS